MRTKTCPRCHGCGRVPDARYAAADIRKARLKLGLSLRAAAKQVHCSPAYMSALERGLSQPEGPAAERVLKLVGLA